MSGFFILASVLSSIGLVTALLMGHAGHVFYLSGSTHMLFGLGSTLIAVSVHCLVFGIFTGSGKDTRELVQDLSLNAEFIAQTKAFRKEVFPPALYSILLLVLTSILGGASSLAPNWVALLHPVLGWFSVLYNLKTFLVESRAVRINACILERVNREATEKITTHPEEGMAIPEIAGVVNAATSQLEWGTHVFALGKFLCFLGYNTWLPYVYLRFIVGYLNWPLWPFLGVSLVFLAGGYYLRWRYQEFRPQRVQVAA